MKVLVTRRLSAAQKTAANLVAAGFEPVLLPLFEIEEISSEMPNSALDFLVFTSVAAVEVIEKVPGEQNADGKMSKTVPAYAVGPETFHALTSAGYSNVRQGNGDAKSLAASIALDFENLGAHGVHVCGEKLAFDFKKHFETEEISVLQCPVYRVLEVKIDKSVLKTALEEVHNGCVMLYSPASANAFFGQVRSNGLEHLLKTVTFVAISEKTAKNASGIPVKALQISDEPNEPAMLNLLRRVAE